MLVILVVVATLASVHCSHEVVPVLLWGEGIQSNLDVPALAIFSSEDLRYKIVQPIVEDSKTKVNLFLQDDLLGKDFSSYLNVKEMVYGSKSIYLPRVSNALDAFTNSSKNLIHVHMLESPTMDQDRSKVMKTNDDYISKHCSKDSVCILTGKREFSKEIPLMSRKLLQTTEDSSLNLYYKDNAVLIYTKTPPILKSLNSKTESKLSPTTSPVTVKDKMVVVVKLQNKENQNEAFRLSFLFASSGNSWNLTEIQISTQNSPSLLSSLKTKTYIGSSIGYSFHTPSKVTFSGSEYELVFDSLQIQYFNGVPHPQKFDVADDTVYFFTIPILSGLFVTSLLITIVLMGLSMIFDIKTMDLFDDPKGKTVTINASE